MKIWKTRNDYTVTQILSGRSNVFLVKVHGKNILVDTGPGRLWNTLDKRLRITGISSLDYLVLTHTHFDHAGSAAKIRNEFGAKVIVHKSEALFLEKGMNSIIKGTNKYIDFIVSLIAPKIVRKMNYEPCMSDIQTGDSYYQLFPNIMVSVIHTPGHSPGSQCVIVDNEIAIVGDTMFGLFKGSIFPPFALDTIKMVTSWGRLLETKCILFLPSHGKSRNRESVEKEYCKKTSNERQ